MSFGSGKIWMNGELVDWDDAHVHVASHVIHYGSGVFEGIRCYDTPKGSVCFRMDAHLRRLYDSARIYRMTLDIQPDAFREAIIDTIRANQYSACYIRPLVYRGYRELGVNPSECPVETAVIVWEWGAYLGEEALEKGVDVQVSSWSRSSPNTFPAMAKSTANYANSQLIKMEANLNGYSEAIALDPAGLVSEGSGQNIFVIRDGTIFTPAMGGSVLPGITRDVILTLSQDLGIPIKEQPIPREMLYIADEVFFTGTAAEISPIRSIDKIVIGNGNRGPVTAALQRRFFDVVNGNIADTHNWLSPVYEGSTETLTQTT